MKTVTASVCEMELLSTF